LSLLERVSAGSFSISILLFITRRKKLSGGAYSPLPKLFSTLWHGLPARENTAKMAVPHGF
jgi:hypothetical protein